MSINKNIGIRQIKYGEVYLYYPIKIVPNENINNVKKSIMNSPLIIGDDYFDKMKNHLYQLEKKSIRYILENDNSIPEIQFYTNESIDIDEGYEFPCFSEYRANVKQVQNNQLIVTIDSLEEEKILDYITVMNRSKKNMSKIYGSIYEDSYDYFFIRPAKMHMLNEEKEWLNTCLYLYENGAIIIKINFPLIDCDTSKMIENDLDGYFEKIITYDGKEFKTCKNYIRYLINEIFAKYNLILDNEFYYINLLEFDGIPYDIKTINDQLIKDLYLITCSPVPEISRNNCLIDARKHFKENSFKLTESLYILKTTGGCLHIHSKKATDFYLRRLAEEGIQKKDALHLISNDLCTATEFSINVILLKKVIISAAIYNLTNNANLYKEKKQYNDNQLFINKIQGNCYGSVSLQIKQFEKILELYSQKELLNERFKIMSDSLSLDEARKKEQNSGFFSIVTFIFTMLFGLPTITETLMIVKKGFFYDDIIPYLSLEQISIIIWVVLMFFCAIKIHIISCAKTILTSIIQRNN